MTPAELLALASFFGPLALERLTTAALGKHWAQDVVRRISSDVSPAFRWRERRRLRRALGERGWESLVSHARGNRSPLTELVSFALGSNDQSHAEVIADAIAMNVAASLEPTDLATWLDLRLTELQRSIDARPATGGSNAERLGESAYSQHTASLARLRRWRLRTSAELSNNQVARSFGTVDVSISQLNELRPGNAAFVVAPIGAGKSDVVLDWMIRSADAATASASARLPVLIRGDSLGRSLREAVLLEVSVEQLGRRGADLVVDGLDESGASAFSLADQAMEFVGEWPLSRVVVSSRAPEIPHGAIMVEVPEWSDDAVERLMSSITGDEHARGLYAYSPEIQKSLHRPLFAVFAALVPQGTTTYEMVAELANRARAGRPDARMRDLAVAIIRNGGPIDPREIGSLGSGPHSDRLIDEENGRWRFQLPIFLQWFAAQGVLDGTVPETEFTQSLAAFAEWRYVLAVALTGASTRRLDEILRTVSEWNPGAGSWLINEIRRQGFRDDPGYKFDSTELARRSLVAIESLTLPGGGLANGRFGTDLFSIAASSDGTRGIVQWRKRMSGEPRIGEVIPYSAEVGDRWCETLSFSRYGSDVAPWEYALDRLKDAHEHSLEAPHRFVPADSIIGIEFRHRAWMALTNRGRERADAAWVGLKNRIGAPFSAVNIDGLQVESAVLEEVAASPDAWSAHGPWTGPDRDYTVNWVGGNYSDQALRQRTEDVVSAAITAYLELTETAFASLGDALGHRARLPGTFVGTVFPAGETWPTMAHHFLPAATRTEGLAGNTVAIDVGRHGERIPTDEVWAALEPADRARRANVPDTQFALQGTHSISSLDIFGTRPATTMALNWLVGDLAFLGRHGSKHVDLR